MWLIHIHIYSRHSHTFVDAKDAFRQNQKYRNLSYRISINKQIIFWSSLHRVRQSPFMGSTDNIHMTITWNHMESIAFLLIDLFSIKRTFNCLWLTFNVSRTMDASVIFGFSALFCFFSSHFSIYRMQDDAREITFMYVNRLILISFPHSRHFTFIFGVSSSVFNIHYFCFFFLCVYAPFHLPWFVCYTHKKKEESWRTHNDCVYSRQCTPYPCLLIIWSGWHVPLLSPVLKSTGNDVPRIFFMILLHPKDVYRIPYTIHYAWAFILMYSSFHIPSHSLFRPFCCFYFSSSVAHCRNKQ